MHSWLLRLLACLCGAMSCAVTTFQLFQHVSKTPMCNGWHVMQDFSDLVAQKAAQQKRKAAQAKESGKAKKQKSDNFKF